MAIPVIQTSVNAGELSPSLYGRVDLVKYRAGCSTLRNMWASYKGGASSRAGTKFVGVARQDADDYPPELIPFQFSVDQGYCLVFCDREMSVVRDGAYITNDPFTLSAVTNSTSAVFTAAGNDFTTASWVYLTGMLGMTDLNGGTYAIDTIPTTGSFTIKSIFTGTTISTTLSGTYTTSSGTVASIYTLTTPYVSADLQLLKWAQSADVMTLVHNNYAPRDLARIEDNNWSLTTTTFATSISPPTTLSSTASTTTTATQSTQYQFVVTAVDGATGQESVASSKTTITNSVNIAQTLGSLTVTWSTVTNAQYYNIYKAPPSFGGPVPVGALFGYAGSSFGLTFVDSNITQEMSTTPPQHFNPFAIGAVQYFTMTSTGSGYVNTASNTVSIFGSGSGATAEAVVSNGGVFALIVVNQGSGYATSGTTASVAGGSTTATAVAHVGPTTGTYPGCVSYFQDRRFYANTTNQPDTYFGSQPGAYTNMDRSIPTTDADAIIGTPWAQQVNGIQAMVNMPRGLVMLTGLGAWQLSGGAPGAALTPSQQTATPQAYNGIAPAVRPLTINFDILYVQNKGSNVRDLNYNFFADIYTGADLTVLSTHLFTGRDIRRWDWAEEPYKLVWAVRDDGTLLSLTYLKTPSAAGQSAENDIYSWARHDTQGSFHGVAVVTEPPVDAPYFVVKRFLPGAS